MLVATLCFALMHAFIKSFSHYHVFEIVFFRSALTAGMCTMYLRSNRIPLIGKRQNLLIWRAVCGILSMTLFFITLQRMPMGASVSLKYLSPIFTAIFAVIFLKEQIKKLQWFFFLTALLGVLLLKGYDNRIDTFNFILGISGAAFGGIVYVLIRKIGQKEHPMVIINYFMLLATGLSGMAMIPYWITPIGVEWFSLLMIGIIGFFGQVYMTKAFQIELASRIAHIKYIEVVYSLLIGLIWFGESYTLLSLMGILLILISMILNVFIKK